MLTPLPIPENPNPYQTIKTSEIYASPWITVREDAFRHRQGAQGIYSVVSIKHQACGVVAIDDDDRLVLVGQWRYPLEEYSWEIPEGGGGLDESPIECMKRELAEECQLEARCWNPLGYYRPSNSKTDEEAFLFLAEGLSPCSGEAESDEELMVRREPFSECLERISSGELTDGLTVTGIFMAHAYRKGLLPILSDELQQRFFTTRVSPT
jgi:8-oxo-dGTP pyrophosphatase MutT (NUDIX family)